MPSSGTWLYTIAYKTSKMYLSVDNKVIQLWQDVKSMVLEDCTLLPYISEHTRCIFKQVSKTVSISITTR